MKKLQIAVGIIRNENNEIFITRRAVDAHMANKLEFPGGFWSGGICSRNRRNAAGYAGIRSGTLQRLSLIHI